MGTAPSAILLRGKIIHFSGYEKSLIYSLAAGKAYRNGIDFGLACYAEARHFALTRYTWK